MAKSNAAAWSFDPDGVNTAGNVTLVVARRSGKNLKGNRVSLHQDVAGELRKVCKTTLAIFKTKTPKAFDPDLDIESDQFLTAADEIVDVDASVRKLVEGESSLPFLAADQLPNQGFLFYAVIVGPVDDRCAFIRKYNPRQVAKAGKFWAVFGDDLRKLDEPIFVFDARCDMVLTKEGIAALNQSAFTQIFRDLSVMTERLPVYVNHITSHLPMAGDGGVRFLAKCVQNSRVANRARSIFERGHLKNVTMDNVIAEIKKQKLDESKLVKKGQLVFDDAEPYTLLKLLNEDLFIGGLSSTPYEAGSKSARSS